MPHRIARALESLLRLLPLPGRHRAASGPARPRPEVPPYRHTSPHPSAVLNGDEVALVRPYVPAAEERREQRAQRRRRRVLLLAACGIDTGPHWIHRVEVAR